MMASGLSHFFTAYTGQRTATYRPDYAATQARVSAQQQARAEAPRMKKMRKVLQGAARSSAKAGERAFHFFTALGEFMLSSFRHHTPFLAVGPRFHIESAPPRQRSIANFSGDADISSKFHIYGTSLTPICFIYFLLLSHRMVI